MDTGLIGKMVKHYRSERGYTQQQFAERAGISTNYLSAIERGTQTPKLETFLAITNALGVTADALLLGSLEKARDLQAGFLVEQMQGLSDEQVKVVINVVGQLSTDLREMNKRRESD